MHERDEDFAKYESGDRGILAAGNKYAYHEGEDEEVAHNESENDKPEHGDSANHEFEDYN